MNKLTPLVDTHIANIIAGKYSDQQLRSLFINIDRQDELLEEDRERLVQAIEEYLRISAPRIAKAMFGPKDLEAREQLARIWQSATQSIDQTKNRHKGGVKSGGSMLRGDTHVDVYISYKNAQNQAVTLAIIQLTPNDRMTAKLSQYVVGGETSVEEVSPYDELATLGNSFGAIVAQLAKLP